MRTPRSPASLVGRTTTWFAVCVAALAMTATACSIPEDAEPRVLTVPTPTPVAEAPTPTPVITESTTIYLTDDQRRVRPANRELPRPLTISSLIEELRETPTEGELALGLASAIPPDLMMFSEPTADETGLATVDFVTGGLDTLTGDELILAVAQLVWTLTESPSVERVKIRIDGVDEQWPTDGDDKLILERNDYRSFDPERVEPTPVPIDEEPPTEEAPTEVPSTTPVPEDPTPTAAPADATATPTTAADGDGGG